MKRFLESTEKFRANTVSKMLYHLWVIRSIETGGSPFTSVYSLYVKGFYSLYVKGLSHHYVKGDPDEVEILRKRWGLK